MRSKERRRTWIWLSGLILIAAGILYLELGSRRYYDGVVEQISLPPAAICNPELYPPDPAKLAALETLLEVYRQGKRISSDDLERAQIVVPQMDMPYRNGTFCNGMIFISQRLSSSARRYVARHELEHYFQFQGLDGGCRDWELCATWQAAREYPWGFITTISSSLAESYRLSPGLKDFLFSSWTIFKIYLLP